MPLPEIEKKNFDLQTTIVSENYSSLPGTLLNKIDLNHTKIEMTKSLPYQDITLLSNCTF